MNESKTEAHHHRYVPIDLINDILLRLPVKSLLRCKSVSKSWYYVINDPNFIKLHLRRGLETDSNTSLIMIDDHYAQLIQGLMSVVCNVNKHADTNVAHQLCYPKHIIPPYAQCVGSCHGVLCFLYVPHRRDQHYCLYNPATRAYKVLPVFNFTIGEEFHAIMSIGYDSISDEFKVMKIVYLLSFAWPNIVEQTLLYSSKADAWEIIESPPWNDNVLRTSSAVFANNAFHWLSPSSKEIMCFNISTQRYYVKLVPENISSNSPKLTALQGQLCLVTYEFDIWILKEYDNDEGWTQLFRNLYEIFNGDDLQANWIYELNISCLRDGSNNNIIIVPSKGRDITRRRMHKVLIYCNLKYGTLKKIDISYGFEPYNLLLADTQPWVESLLDPAYCRAALS